jgi:hypothetical protein
MSKKNPSAAALATQLFIKTGELALAAPQVVAHRVTRMALAGPVLSARDQQEFSTMVLEKQTALAQSWSAMASETLRINQAFAASMMGAFWAPLSGTRLPSRQISRQVQSAVLRIANQGLAPVHKKAVGNSKRLAKTKLR